MEPGEPVVPTIEEGHCYACQAVTKHQRITNGSLICLLCVARAQEQVHPASQPIQARRQGVSLARNLAGITVLVLLVWYVGSVHCVHTPNGTKVVDKEEWGFYDQFVDVDEFMGKSLIELLPRARTVRALVRAGLLQLPEQPKR